MTRMRPALAARPRRWAPIRSDPIALAARP